MRECWRSRQFIDHMLYPMLVGSRPTPPLSAVEARGCFGGQLRDEDTNRAGSGSVPRLLRLLCRGRAGRVRFFLLLLQGEGYGACPDSVDMRGKCGRT